jgi:hypothetical protein
VNRADGLALVEYFELKPTYLAVISKHKVMNNRFIGNGFTTVVDLELLSPFIAESALLDSRSPQPAACSLQPSDPYHARELHTCFSTTRRINRSEMLCPEMQEKMRVRARFWDRDFPIA